MPTIIIQLFLSTLVIVGAGIFLTRFSDKIAEETGFGQALVGSILLAGATSLPELVVDVHAIRLGQPDLAVGDLLGSSLFNLLILAVVDTAFRHPRRAFTPDFAQHAQSAVLSINLTALVGIGILAKLETTFFGVGIFTWIAAGAYLIGARLTFQAPLHNLHTETPGRSLTADSARIKRLARAVFGFLISLSLILFTAPYLVQAADQLAVISGLGHTFVGTTLVALSTSLPELVATITAFKWVPLTWRSATSLAATPSTCYSFFPWML
jgi:cation:H+ antiporter